MNTVAEMWRHYLHDMNRLGVKFDSEDAKRHFMAGVILTLGKMGKGTDIATLLKDFDEVNLKEK